tara:strand:- start:11653 stop:12639 length:987 start_codon:yes stop_codon:yes gene_type:complete
MKLLITGGLGFIGSNFILHTLQKYPDYKITNIDAEFFGSNQKNVESVRNNSNYTFVKGNITNKKLMEKLITDSDIIVNFAAESFVDRSIVDANPFLVSNIRGTYTILDIIKDQKKKLIHISTDEVFGSLEETEADEDFKLNPSNPYAATKASAELLVRSYNQTFGTDCIITRCTNNYGPRQFPEKFIPKVILLASQKKEIPIYGSGNNIRDWLYVTDHCDAILKIMNQGNSNESYNISSQNYSDNTSLVKKILSMMNCSHDLIKYVEDRPGHDKRYGMNSSKIKNELKWNPCVDLENGLSQTIDWYLNNSEWWKDISSNLLSSTPWKN